ncbi:MAG: cation diffusion facilitator family transporter [Nitrososphaeria archaeon]
MPETTCFVDSTKRLGVALSITLAFFVVELLGGILTNSLALLTDAWHMLNDVFGLAFAVAASLVASRPNTVKKTYGYYRVEIVAGFLNGILLWAIVIFIVLEAFQRIQKPQPIDSLNVLVIALFGLVANGLSALVLSKGRRSSLNVKGAFLHVLSDALGSIGVISAASIMLLTEWYQADAVISIFVGALMFYGAGKLVFESLNILLEGVPVGIDMPLLERRISGIHGVKSVHDLHVWCITPNKTCCLSCHIILEEKVDRKALLSELIHVLKKEFGIDHTTFQFEGEDYPKAANEH